MGRARMSMVTLVVAIAGAGAACSAGSGDGDGKRFYGPSDVFVGKVVVEREGDRLAVTQAASGLLRTGIYGLLGLGAIVLAIAAKMRFGPTRTTIELDRKAGEARWYRRRWAPRTLRLADVEAADMESSPEGQTLFFALAGGKKVYLPTNPTDDADSVADMTAARDAVTRFLRGEGDRLERTFRTRSSMGAFLRGGVLGAAVLTTAVIWGNMVTRQEVVLDKAAGQVRVVVRPLVGFGRTVETFPLSDIRGAVEARAGDRARLRLELAHGTLTVGVGTPEELAPVADGLRGLIGIAVRPAE
ncbi:MAG TPA: hypothetical protein VKE22_13335 [Haliangiales bacterium]|nr:hypothetical protein [Haliangiales bacterium]